MIALPKVLTIKFDEPLSQGKFWWLVERMYGEPSMFLLWGDPIWLGPRKVHVYGADKNEWRPLNVEVTHRGISAIGNSIDYMRLIANLRREVTGFKAWIGKDPV